MKYFQVYKSFIHGHNVNEGIRMTAGIALPAFVMGYFGQLATGIVMAVGALCVTATDNPGPVQHRVNGMLVCNALIFFTAIITGLASNSPVILGVILCLFCFLFSMLGVYGTRESSIGLAGLLVMVLNLQHPKQGWQIVVNALYVLAGGMWYMLFSLMLHRIRPYKQIQQFLGDYIQSISDYLRERAAFYQKNTNYEEAYNRLMAKQAHVQELQNTVNELLFRTRTIVKESTPKGRTLVMIYLDVTDVFERAMTSYQDYTKLHGYFDETVIFEKIRPVLLQMADELFDIGISVKSGTPSHENSEITRQLKNTRKYYHDLRQNFMKPVNLEGFVSMGRIIESLQDLLERINILHQHTAYNVRLKKRSLQAIPYEKLVDHKAIEPQLLLDNLNFNSHIFRHSLRVSAAVLTGFVISMLFNTGHSYWILLTIIVILKPAYSLTKKRNKDRIIGTVCGVVIGVAAILLIKNDLALLILMIILMAGCYIFLRTNYFIAVLLMTPYLLIFFHLLYPANFRELLMDRIIDTVIGSAIAFVISIFFVPAWEHTTIKTYMIKMLEHISDYYKVTASGFAGQAILLDQLRIARKNAFVALANLSDAFTRMLSEPKRHQRDIEKIHRFVVLNHMLTSHIATLSYFLQTRKTYYRSPAFEPVATETLAYISDAVASLETGTSTTFAPEKKALRALNEDAELLMQKRKHELEEGLLETETKNLLVQTKSVTDQFNFVYSLAADIHKLTNKIAV